MVEVVSPVLPHARDRRWKPEAYAEAGIPTFVRLELDGPDGPVVHAFTLVDGTYIAAATLTGLQPQEVALPFAVTLASCHSRRPARIAAREVSFATPHGR